jgi:hypothetical protein
MAPVAADFANNAQLKWIMGRGFTQWPTMLAARDLTGMKTSK